MWMVAYTSVSLQVLVLCLHICCRKEDPFQSTLAWRIPWTEEPGRLQSVGSRRVGHD